MQNVNWLVRGVLCLIHIARLDSTKLLCRVASRRVDGVNWIIDDSLETVADATSISCR